MKKNKKLTVIAGPTASGKTALAVKAAKLFDAEIISADSMQIYKYMNIGTAKPTYEEMDGIRHHMIDIVNPDEMFSVYDYSVRARKIIDDCFEREKNVIVVGGTGLYIDHLIYNIQLAPKSGNTKIREKLEKRLEDEGIVPLYEELKKIDAQASEKIHINNTKRVIRALEVYYSTGKTMSEQNRLSRTEKPQFETLVMIPMHEREILYERINRRVEQMFEAGLEKEVQTLIGMGYGKNLNAMQAIGYKEMISYFENNCTAEEAKEKIKQNTRHYAKRQLTWFKRNKDLVYLKEDMQKMCFENIKKFLNNANR